MTAVLILIWAIAGAIGIGINCAAGSPDDPWEVIIALTLVALAVSAGIVIANRKNKGK